MNRSAVIVRLVLLLGLLGAIIAYKGRCSAQIGRFFESLDEKPASPPAPPAR